MKKCLHLVVCVFVAAVSLLSCRSPLLSAGRVTASANLSLAVRIPSVLPDGQPQSSRALLPGTETISLTITRNATILYSETIPITLDLTAAVTIEALPAGVSLRVVASADDALGTYAVGEANLVLQAGSNNLSLALLPSNTQTVQPGINRNLSGLASANRVFRMVIPRAGQWTLLLQPLVAGQLPNRTLVFGNDGRALNAWNEAALAGSFGLSAGNNLYLAAWDAPATFNVRLARSPQGVRETAFAGSGSRYSFGSRTAFPHTVADAAVLSDGRIVVAGMVNPGQQTPFLAMVKAEGGLDESFNLNGVRTFQPLGASVSALLYCAVDSSDRILAAGTIDSNQNKDWFVCRFLPDGRLDTSFGSEGYARINPYSLASGPDLYEDSLAGLKLDSAGRIILAGKTSWGTTFWSAVRLSPDGMADTSFASNGAYMGLVATSTDMLYDFAIGPGDDIIVLGTNSTNRSWVRLRSDNGSSYIGNGWSGGIQEIPGISTFPRRVAYRDGSLYLVGPNSTSSIVYRYAYTNVSTLDSSYGSGGSSGIAGLDASHWSLAFDAAGALLVGAQWAGSPQTLVVRILPTGTIDMAFEKSWSDSTPINDGLVGLPLGDDPNKERFARCLVLADGRILLAGTANSPVSNNEDPYIAVLNGNGDWSTFGSGGVFDFSTTYASQNFLAGALFDDGSSAAVGSSNGKAYYQLFDADGALLHTGDVSNIPGSGSWTTSAMTAACSAPDGSVFLAGNYNQSGTPGLFIIKLRPDRTYDMTFDGDGVKTHAVTPTYDSVTVKSIIADSQGRVYVGGSVLHETIETSSFIVCFNADGDLETAFGNNGFALVNNSNQSYDDYVSAMAIAPDGTVFAAGMYYNETSGNEDSFVFKVSPAGVVTGPVYLDIEARLAGTDIDIPYALVLQADGLPMVVGTARTGMEPYTGEGWLFKRNTDLTAHAAFGSNGFMRLSYDSVTSAFSAAAHPDGSTFITGTVQNDTGGSQSFLTRLNPDGTLTRLVGDSYAATGSTPRFLAIGMAGDAWLFGNGFSGSIGYGFITRVR